MTDERKQQLTQLLQEALAHLEIRRDSAGRHESIPVNKYRAILLRHWRSSSMEMERLSICYEPHIVNSFTRSKLLDFIREEFSEFIYEDHIQSAFYFIQNGGPVFGYPLDNLLKQLLRIAIMLGEEKAVLDFDRCTKKPSGSFQYIVLLEGVRVEKEIRVFESTRIVPLSNSSSEFPHYLPFSFLIRPSDLLGKTLLVIDASISPIFSAPPPPPPPGTDDGSIAETEFQVEITGENFSNVNVDNIYGRSEYYVYDFYDKFCWALSLTCNSAVKATARWKFLEKYELFHLSSIGVSGVRNINDFDPSRFSTGAGETQIGEAKRLYKKLVDPSLNVVGKLQIPIDRWIKSKTSKTPVDKLIDLGIAFEALYLSETDYNREVTFRFSLHAALHLGEDLEQRKTLMQEFKKIYKWRSMVVHSGKLSEKIMNNPEEAEAFIARAQDLCRDSILKILEDGRFPDWNDLILGEKSL